MENIRLYACRRGREEWEGALIVGAENNTEATNICIELLQKESIDKPYTVRELLLKKGLIYDDKLR